MLGKNYEQAGLGLGLATVLGFALQTKTGSPGQTVGAAFVGVAFVVLLRILLKARDPSDVTRDLVAQTLTAAAPDFEQAYAMWLRDKPVRWLGNSLRTAVEYRTIRSVLAAHEAAAADVRAAEVATLVAARSPSETRLGGDDPSPGTTPRSTSLDHALRALNHLETTARRRDMTSVDDAPATRRAFAWRRYGRC